MKNLTYIFACLLFHITSFSQVGINTTDPTSMLDVNGTIRVRTMSAGTDRNIRAVKVVGMDEDGNFVEVEMDKNIDLINNKLTVTDRTLELGNLPAPFLAARNHNVSLRVLPGEGNHGKSIIRIVNTAGVGDTEITGIEAAPDGTHIWLYAVSGKLTLINNSLESFPGNRIEKNDKMAARQYGMIELFYDGARGIWIVMQNHQ